MKHYQDTITGQIYAFTKYDNVEKLMQTNRNLPKTLTDSVKEKPSDNHVWYKKDWIHEKEKPIDYKEPISEIPIYNPAWITFLFKEGTILFNEQNKFQIGLDQINNNSYNGKELSKVIIALPNNDKNTTLPILVTVDGSIILPVNEIYQTQEMAVNKMNEIISALFLGGLNINAIYLEDLEQGTLLEGGECSFSYIPSSYLIMRKLSEQEMNSIFKQLKIKQAEKINMKLKVLKEGKVISKNCYDILDMARDERNDLVHEGKLPNYNLVEKLWIVLFEMFEIAFNKKLDKLFELTIDKQSNKIKRFYNNTHNGVTNSKTTNFDEWKSYNSID